VNSSLIPIPPINLKPNILSAFEKAKTLLNENKAQFENSVTLLKDDAGKLIKDADGNVLGEIEVTLEDGSKEKTQILLNEDEAKLKSAVDEVDDGSETISTFESEALAQKLTDIANAWKAVYPQIFVERKLFEDIMATYRYTAANGWSGTNEIAANFKAIDFYKSTSAVGDKIIASTVVSMKTTTTTNLESWLETSAISKNK